MFENILAHLIIVLFCTVLVTVSMRVFEYVIEKVNFIKYKELELDLRRCELFIQLKELKLSDEEIPQVIKDVFKDVEE